jgi:hypothetical protein
MGGREPIIAASWGAPRAGNLPLGEQEPAVANRTAIFALLEAEAVSQIVVTDVGSAASHTSIITNWDTGHGRRRHGNRRA